MDFSVSLYPMDNRLYMQRPQSSVSWTTFTDVFEVPFWIVLSGVMVVLVFSFYFVGKLVKDLEKVPRAIRCSLMKEQMHIGLAHLTDDGAGRW